MRLNFGAKVERLFLFLFSIFDIGKMIWFLHQIQSSSLRCILFLSPKSSTCFSSRSLFVTPERGFNCVLFWCQSRADVPLPVHYFWHQQEDLIPAPITIGFSSDASYFGVKHGESLYPRWRFFLSVCITRLYDMPDDMICLMPDRPERNVCNYMYIILNAEIQKK